MPAALVKLCKVPLLLIVLISWIPLSGAPLVKDGRAQIDQKSIMEGPVQLHGLWDFFPDATPDQLEDRVPVRQFVFGTWPEDAFSEVSDHHYGTYRVQLELDRVQPMALRFTEIMTESCVYLDSQLLQCQGRPGKSREETRPSTTPFTVFFTPTNRHPVITIFVSNFHHRKGGIFGAVSLGTPQQINQLDRQRMSRYLLVAGALMLTTLYFGVMAGIDRNNPTNLALSIFSLIVMVRILTSGEKPIVALFPEFPYDVYIRLQYITFYLSIAAALHHLYSLFPQEARRTMVAVFYGVSGTFAIFAVFASPTFISRTLGIYTAIFFAGAAYCLVVLINALRRRRSGSIFLLVGMLALLTASIVDFLRVYEILLVPYLVGDAILILIVCQAIATSLKTNQMHRSVAELQLERDLADAAARNNRDFLSRMSHELRTPLHSIIHIGHLLREEQDPERTSSYVQTLQSASDHLLTLVNDVLDFNRLAQGKLRYQEGSYSLRMLLHRVVLIHRERASGRGLLLELHIEDDLPDRLLGDSHRISQVLPNLLGNAIKFTDSGFIRLDVTALRGNKNQIRFSVQDTGIGLEPEQLPQIFESYFQAGFQPDRKHEGTGLGLAICKELVHLMGGDLQVQSKPGEGSRFWFDLPLSPDPNPVRALEMSEISQAMSAVQGAPSSRNFRREMIFIVDDNPDNRLLTGRFLERWNLRHMEAASGVEAVALLEQAYPHLVLLDLHMPDMDGFATIAALRDSGYTGPVIAATADVSNETRIRIEAAGFDGFIGKPFSPGNFYQVLSGYLRPDRADSTADFT